MTKTNKLRPVHKYAIKHSELSFDYEDLQIKTSS